jgi:hypothetical protein
MHSTAANDLRASGSFSTRNSLGRLTTSATRTNMVRLIRRTVRPQRIPSGRSVSWRASGGCNSYASGFFEPAASHLPASRFPRNEGLLGQTPRIVSGCRSTGQGYHPACEERVASAYSTSDSWEASTDAVIFSSHGWTGWNGACRQRHHALASATAANAHRSRYVGFFIENGWEQCVEPWRTSAYKRPDGSRVFFSCVSDRAKGHRGIRRIRLANGQLADFAA